MSEFPQIYPCDASPEIAAIYADIRAISGVPMVNLIWRHFAALPEVIQWAWKGVRPLVGSQEMAAARTRLIGAVELPALRPLATEAWQAVGIDAATLPAFTAMMADYVRGNCTNIIALTALRLRLEGIDHAAPGLTPAPLPAPADPLPPLPRIEDLDTGLAAAIRALAKRHDGTDGGIIPSLYLALAPWPGVVDAFSEWLGALYVPEAMRAARESTCRAAEAEAVTMLPTLGPPPRDVSAMRPALERFTRSVIPDLIPVCIAVHQLLSPG